MAWRMKLKLPKFKVTQRESGSSAKSIVNIPRGRSALSTEDTATVSNVSDSSEGELAEDMVLSAEPPPNEFEPTPEAGAFNKHQPSLHEIKQAANVESWGKIRNNILKAVVECSAMPHEQCCNVCGNAGQYRCTECGPPTVYYCVNCLQVSHSSSNILHTAEIWEVSLKFACSN